MNEHFFTGRISIGGNGWDQPINKKLNDWLEPQGIFHVIGVVKDFHYKSISSFTPTRCFKEKFHQLPSAFRS